MSYNTTTQQVNWGGYNFEVCEKSGLWRVSPGLYVFAGFANGYWIAKYIGKTEDFNARIPRHERWEEAVRLGATHVHARIETNAIQRMLIERDLIQRFQPPLNDQLR